MIIKCVAEKVIARCGDEMGEIVSTNQHETIPLVAKSATLKQRHASSARQLREHNDIV